MNGHTFTKQGRIRIRGLGLSALLAGSMLVTSAAGVLAMPAQENSSSRATLGEQVFNSLDGVTWAASKIAAQPEVYLGIDDTAAASTFKAPHQVAPI